MPTYRYTVAYDGCTEPGCCTSFYEREISASSYEEAEAIAEEGANIWDGTVCEIEEIPTTEGES